MGMIISAPRVLLTTNRKSQDPKTKNINILHDGDLIVFKYSTIYGFNVNYFVLIYKTLFRIEKLRFLIY